MFACRNNHVAIVQRIIRTQRNPRLLQELVNKRNADNESALSIAVRLSSVPLVKLLLANGADPDQECADGITPVAIAAGGTDNVELLRLLVEGPDSTTGDVIANLARTVDGPAAVPYIGKGVHCDFSVCEFPRRTISTPLNNHIDGLQSVGVSGPL